MDTTGPKPHTADGGYTPRSGAENELDELLAQAAGLVDDLATDIEAHDPPAARGPSTGTTSTPDSPFPDPPAAGPAPVPEVEKESPEKKRAKAPARSRRAAAKIPLSELTSPRPGIMWTTVEDEGGSPDTAPSADALDSTDSRQVRPATDWHTFLDPRRYRGGIRRPDLATVLARMERPALRVSRVVIRVMGWMDWPLARVGHPLRVVVGLLAMATFLAGLLVLFVSLF